MNKFNDLLLQAFDIAMDEKLSKLEYDKTIPAVIQEIANADTGEYKVKYQDASISAFAYDPKEKFEIGDSVYVTVPQGNFENKKFISHKITNNSLSTNQYNDLADTIIEVSPNFTNLGITANTSGELIAGSITPDEKELLKNGETSLTDNFRLYANKYQYVKISAEFMTTFDGDLITQGDYGVMFIFEGQGGQTIPCLLNTNDFIGDPYQLWTWFPQSTVIKIPNDIKKIKSIIFYEKDFNDTEVKSVSGQSNIYMRNLSFTFVDQVDLTSNPYYLAIISSGGLSFGNETSITLTGKIFHYGNEINPGSCIYKWFERNLNVTVGAQDYDKRVGPGWKAVPNEEGKELILSKSAVQWNEQSYKLLVVFDSNIILTREITILKNQINVKIEQQVDGNNIYLDVVKINNDNITYKALWYYIDANGNWQEIANTESSLTKSKSIVDYLYQSPMTFYCSIYNNSNNNYLGELTYVMRNIESTEDVSVTFIGDSMFSFDANGDINIYDAELERTLTPIITFNNGIISSSVAIDWLDYSGNIIGSQQSSPNESMLKNIWVDSTTKILHYKIKSKFYDYPSSNNTFKIRITTLDGQIYYFDKEIICIKTGDPGTNGTKYQSYIHIVQNTDYPYRFVTTARQVKLQCDVYKESTLLTIDTDYTIKWELINLTSASNSSLLTSSIIVKANSSNFKRYVKVTIKIKEDNFEIYDFYPVDSCTAEAPNDIEGKLSGWFNLPKYIQYASSGKNPQVRRKVPDITYEGSRQTLQHVAGSILTIRNGNFNVVDDFNPSNNIGLLTVNINNSFRLYHPVPAYINTYGNEAINGWDGHQLDIDGKGQYIFAPQVGAGIKNSNDNTFTGVVMGKDTGQAGKIGLYGYNHGTNTFGLMDNGQAYFGTDKGKITIDGTNATIKGGGGGDSSSGMTIDLYGDDSEDLAINIGNENFTVNYGGILTAKGASIDGFLYALSGKIGSTSKTSTNGWTIETNRLYSGSGNGHVELNSNTSSDSNYTIWAGANTPNGSDEKFSVKRDGSVFMREAIVKGAITANTGYIGGTNGWQINTNIIYSSKSNKYVGLSNKGYYAIFAGAAGTDDTGDNSNPAKAPFWVKFDGSMKASAADITGKITANSGLIGGSKGWTITTNKIYSGNVTLYSSNEWNYGIGNIVFNASANVVKNYYTISSNNTVTIKGSVNTGSSIVKAGEIRTIGNIDYLPFKFASGTDTVNVYYARTSDIYNKIPYRIWAGSKNTDPNGASFYVTDGGTMKATAAIIEGAVTAKTGYIGWEKDESGKRGWSISKNTISANNETEYKIKINAKYYTDSACTKNEAIIQQDMPIASFSNFSTTVRSFQFIDEDTTYYTTPATNIAPANQPYVALQSNGNYAFWAGNNSAKDAPFSITHVGGLKAVSANISGKITASSGAIGGWTITGTDIASGDVHLFSGTNGLHAKVTLAANKSYYNYNGGTPTVADTVTADTTYDTTVASFVYNNETYYRFGTSGKFCVKASDLITNGLAYYRIWAGSSHGRNADFSVTDKGEIVAKGSITASSGSIGGWIIDSSKIYSESGKRGLSSTGIKAYNKDSEIITDPYLYYTSGTRYFYRAEDEQSFTLPKNIKYYIANVSAKDNNNKYFYFVDDDKSTPPSGTDVDTRYYINKSYITYSTDEADRLVFWSGATYNSANDTLSLPNRYFAVSSSGKLYCADAEVNGTISADRGSIGGWMVSKNSLSNSTGTISLNSNTGTIKGANISGANISGGTLSITGGTNGSLTVDDDGVSITGDVSTGNLDATGGTIGGWTIDASAIKGGYTEPEGQAGYYKTQLKNTGSICGAKICDIKETGYFEFTTGGGNSQNAYGFKIVKKVKGNDNEVFSVFDDDGFNEDNSQKAVWMKVGSKQSAFLQVFYYPLVSVLPKGGWRFDIDDGGCAHFPYGSSVPDANTHGYGHLGAVYFKIS